MQVVATVQDGVARDTEGKPLEADTSSNDIDEHSIDTDEESFYTSLATSVKAYVYENGRRYHAQTDQYYMLPNDDAELDREEVKHHALRLLMGGKLTLAPLPAEPERIIDIGTGNGLWAVDIADLYPNTAVIGMDISPVAPTWVPQNLRFEVDDANLDWVYTPDSVDLIHLRYMYTAIRDFPQLFQQAMTVLKPGGWIEIVEYDMEGKTDDNSIPKDSKVRQFLDKIREAASQVGFDLTITRKFKSLVEQAGFEEVSETLLPMPMGSWPKDKVMKQAGMLNMEQMTGGMSGMAMRLFVNVLGWEPEQVEVAVTEAKKELRDPSIHAYWNNHIIIGRKPVKEENGDAP